jgi:hypothetical protein
MKTRIFFWALLFAATTASAQTVVYRPTPIYWQVAGLVQTCLASGACPSWVDVDDDVRRITLGQNTFWCLQDRAQPTSRAVVGSATVLQEEVMRDRPGVLLDMVNPMLRRPAPNAALLACFPDWPVPPVALGEPIYGAVLLTPSGAIDWARMNAETRTGTTTAGEVCGPSIAAQAPVTGSTDPAVRWHWLRTGGTRCRP